MGNEQKGNIPKKRSTRTEKNKNYFFSSFYLCDRNDQKKKFGDHNIDMSSFMLLFAFKKTST